MNPETKHCRKCGKTKPASEFYKAGAGKLRSPCMTCRKASAKVNDKDRYQKNPTAAKARQQRWKEKHPDARRQYSREGMRKSRQAKKDVGQEFFPLKDPHKGIAARRKR